MKKINAKGFTLIELLAVITIMGILLFVGIPLVSRIIFNSRKDTSEVSVKSYTNEVNKEIKSQEIDNNIIDDGKYSIMKNGNLCLSTEYDKESDTCYVDVLEVDMEGSTPEGGEIEIINHKVAGVYNVEINKFYVNSEEDNYIASSDPVIPKNTICQTTGNVSYATGTLYKCEVAEGIFYDFRILNVSGDTVNLLMASNLINEVLYFDWDGNTLCSSAEAAFSRCGPLTAYKKLNEVTRSWDNLNILTYSYTSDKFAIKNKWLGNSSFKISLMPYSNFISADYSGWVYPDNDTGYDCTCDPATSGININIPGEGLKARLPERKEIDALGGVSWYKSGNGYWLNDIYGTTLSDQSKAKAVNGEFGDSHTANKPLGIRPVIQVTKADLS